MSDTAITEGEAPFAVSTAGKPCKTWYKVVGSLDSGTRPLVAVHGGPGTPHRYLLSLVDLYTKHGIPVVFYDQLGNGNSTHLPEKIGDAEFWTEKLFLDELENLLKFLGIESDYDLLGQSWGGMLASRHASLQPAGLKRLVLASAPASMALFEQSTTHLRTLLPANVAQTLSEHEAAGTTQSPEYQKAARVFYGRHVCRIKPVESIPLDVLDAFQWIEKDPTVYFTMNGPSEFHTTGTLKSWSMLDDASKIVVPTLLLNGAYDEASDATVYPFFERISGPVRWVTLSESSHTAHWEERDRFMELVAGFLKSDVSALGGRGAIQKSAHAA
uniref:Proline iminopeptidase n=1 Tax=Mycena chlorophos TaxID=658473 RepID=A0ABQ0KY03_MYCCL|nr:proline iminopeptidase [Mycena chlorophos]